MGGIAKLFGSVAPVRERGLKLQCYMNDVAYSRVAPVRERGLKFTTANGQICAVGRSREGAWIEILSLFLYNLHTASLP